jgi:hypothetical protein
MSCKLITTTAIAFGKLHNSQWRSNNPVVPPYFGEIPYSGRQVVIGYWDGNRSNPIFNQYKNDALYGNKKTDE